MSRLLTLGFETGLATEFGGTQAVGGLYSTPSTSTGTVNPGGSTRSLVLNDSNRGPGTSSGSLVKWTYPAQTTLFGRVSFYEVELGLVNASNLQPFLILSSSVGNQVYFSMNVATSLLEAWTYNGSGTSGGFTKIGTATAPFTRRGWNLIQFAITASTTVGTLTITQNGVQVMNLSGVNTCPNGATISYSGLSLGIGDLLGILATPPPDNFGGGDNLYIDDVALNSSAGTINNSLPANGSIVYLKPAADSTPLAWTPSTAGAHFSLENTLPPTQTTNFVSTTVTTTEDEYTVTSLPVAASGAAIVIPVAYAAVPTGTANLETRLISTGTTHTSGATALGSVPAQVSDPQETDPHTSAAWTASAVNALKIGLVSA